jgi:hypothetical protein
MRGNGGNDCLVGGAVDSLRGDGGTASASTVSASTPPVRRRSIRQRQRGREADTFRDLLAAEIPLGDHGLAKIKEWSVPASP